MDKSSKHPALSLLASAMLLLLPVVGLTRCTSSASDNSSTVETGRQQLITADSLAGLKPGEHLVLDLSEQGVAYTFDFSKAPIDFSRIALLQHDGDTQPMDKWLSAMKEKGRDLLAASNHSFGLAPSAQSFGDLSAIEVVQLQSTGNLVKSTKVSANASGTVSAPSLSPQFQQCYDYYECGYWCHDSVPPFNPYCYSVCYLTGSWCEEIEP